MTFQIVLNNLEQGIKHANGVSVLCFASEDVSFKVDTFMLPVATVSEVSNT